jgi:hypothetical protein
MKQHPMIPSDRTERQPLVWVCANPQCGDETGPFEFTADEPKCPKCSANHPALVTLKALVHLVVESANGRIKGQYASYELACDPNRSTIATTTNREAGSNIPVAVNCPECLAWLDTNNIHRASVDPIKQTNPVAG